MRPETASAEIPGAAYTEAADALTAAEELLAAEDIAGLVRHLRTQGEALPMLDFVRVLRDAARSVRCARLLSGSRASSSGSGRAVP